MVAARRGAVHAGGATFHVVHAAVADLPAVGGQMIMVMGRCDCKRCTAQPSNCFDGATLRVFWWVMGEQSNTATPPPSRLYKGIVWKKCGTVSHRGNPVVLAEQAKAFHAVGATCVITASLFCSQSPLERKRGWRGWGWVGGLHVRGVNGMGT